MGKESHPTGKFITAKQAVDSTAEGIKKWRKSFYQRTDLVRYGVHLDIRVYRPTIERALMVAAEFLNRATSMDCRITEGKARTAWGSSTLTGEASPVAIVYDNQEIGFEITERGKRKIVKSDLGWDSHEFIPTGILTLKFKGYDFPFRCSWEEKAACKLEEHFKEILATIPPLSKLLKKQQEEREAWHAQLDERFRLEEIERERLKAKKRDNKRFLKAFKQWMSLGKQRKFVDAMEKLYVGDPPQEFMEWLAFAKNHLREMEENFRPWEKSQESAP